MDIDVDWCLTCQKHISLSVSPLLNPHHPQEGNSPYCSSACHSRAASATFAVHNDTGHDHEHHHDHHHLILGPRSSAIAAWAADIPPNAPPPQDPIPTPHPPRNRAPPNLLKSSRRIAPPCLSTLLHPESSPNLTSSHPPPPPQSSNPASLTKTSSKSAQSDSPLSTPSSSQCHPSLPIFCPSRKSSILGDMYVHVRSWVAPTPAIFVPVQRPHQQRPPLPVHRVDSSSKFRFTTHPPTSKKSLAYDHYIARGHHLPELAFNDEPPSFRARGRKASRAAA